jgi:type II secretory pathway component GspD/PulD (secretin)
MAIRSPRWAARLRVPILGALALVGVFFARPVAADQEGLEASTVREFDIGDGLVTFDVTEQPFGQIVTERIQPKTRINLFVTPEAASERVTLRVVALHWTQALGLMAEKINGTIIKTSLNLIRIERPMPLEISFENAEIGEVIKTIAGYANASVIVSPLVKGTVTVKLKDAPWRAALQAVVETAGKFSLVPGDYGMLRVVPTSELELKSDTYVFRYLRPPPPYKGVVKSGASGGSGTAGSSTGGGAGGSATVGAEIVEGNPFIASDEPAKQEEQFPIVAALKTVVAADNGTVTYIPTSNAIIFTGTAPHIAKVKSLCQQLDVEPPQVFIDMNFIATSTTDALQFGMKSDTGLNISLTGSGITHRLPFAASGGGFSDIISGTNFPSPSAASFSYGTLDFGGTNLLFQFLKQDKCSRIVQAPKILALDNQAATIFVGESIRYARSTAASNQNGGLTFSVEEDENSPVNVGFQLLVIPHVIPGENKIMLLVIPQQRALSGTTSPIPGFDRFVVSGQTIDLPRISSSTMVSEMLLRSGETAVIGGLLEDRDVKQQDKVPVLGDLPVLGMLFRGTSIAKVKQNLLITITPRILRGSDAANSVIGDELAGRGGRLCDEWRGLGGPNMPGAMPPPGMMMPPPGAVPPPPPPPVVKPTPEPMPAAMPK